MSLCHTCPQGEYPDTYPCIYLFTYLTYHLVDSNRELLPFFIHSFDIEIKTQLVFGGRFPTLCFFSVPHLNSQRRPLCVRECAVKVIIHKLCGEVSLVEQDAIEYVS